MVKTNKPGPAQVGAISKAQKSKKTSKCQVFFYSTRKSKIFWKKFRKITYSKKWTEWRAKVSQCRKSERGDPLRFFNIHSVAKHEKIEENKNFHFREKISQCRKKLKGGALWNFSTFIVAKHQKNAGGPFGENFFSKKSLAVPKKNERGSLWSCGPPGMVCSAGKQEKPFWFSSLDQIVQFGAKIFCRTFVELFWSVRVDRKKSHYNIRVSLHEAPTKNDKTYDDNNQILA